MDCPSTRGSSRCRKRGRTRVLFYHHLAAHTPCAVGRSASSACQSRGVGEANCREGRENSSSQLEALSVSRGAWEHGNKQSAGGGRGKVSYRFATRSISRVGAGAVWSGVGMVASPLAGKCYSFDCTFVYYQSDPIGCVTGATHARRRSEDSVMNSKHGYKRCSFARGGHSTKLC